MPPAVAVLNIGVGPCWGETFGDLLSAMAVGWESIVYIEKRKGASVYKARSIMPRARARTGATGDAGGAPGGKVRSTEAQKNNRE